jgi:hypothetical protein
MADDQNPPQPPQDQGAAASAASTQSMFSTDFSVPDDVKAQFPDLIDLITRSESMNNEERQYWVNILPIMTPEQVQNLRDILMNERSQLDAIDAKYQTEIDAVGQAEFMKRVEDERKQRAQQRAAAEQQARQGESADDLLKQIEGA